MKKRKKPKTRKASSSGKDNGLGQVEGATAKVQEQVVPSISISALQDLHQNYIQRSKGRGLLQTIRDWSCNLGRHFWARYFMGTVMGEVAGVGMIKGVHTFYCENCGETNGEV